jgi:Fe-S cluster biogenesis protein NfuA
LFVIKNKYVLSLLRIYVFKNDEQAGGGENGMKENVEKALQKIRPSLQADGGDIELIDVVDGIVKVRLTGACGGCPMSQMTLKMGVEKVLKQQVPEVKSVETV